MTEAYIAHISKGRIRVKFSSMKGNEEFFNLLTEKILQNEALLKIRTNPITGSILIEHEKSTEDIIVLLKNLNMFEIKEAKEMPKKKIIYSINKNVSYINRIIRKVSSETLDLKSAVLLFLIISAIYQIAKGNLSAIPWYTALFYLNSLISKE